MIWIKSIKKKEIGKKKMLIRIIINLKILILKKNKKKIFNYNKK
jgi:hypothetical protein